MATREEQMRRRWGVAFALVGVLLPIVIGLTTENVRHEWVLYVVATMFFVLGLAMFASERSPIAGLLIGVACLLMSALGFFLAFGPGKGELTGPFVWLLSEEQKERVGRLMVGSGAVMTAAMGIFLMVRSVIGKRGRKSRE